MKIELKYTEDMLKSILNGMDALITVCDHENFDILFLNDAIRKNFGIEESGIGHKCYEILQKRTSPCIGCPYDKISLNSTITWEHQESIDKKILNKNAKLILWPPNKVAHLEYAIDITPLRNEQKQRAKFEQEANKINYDSLTGIFSRHYFEHNIKEILNSFSRSNDKIAVIMIDIDYFKQYNDEYGHLKGDERLKEVAKILKSTLRRQNEFVARFGGEEFVAVLVSTTNEEALAVAKKLRENIENANLEHLKSLVKPIITVSVGVALGSRKTRSELLKNADAMLYQSKEKGRNQVSIISI